MQNETQGIRYIYIYIYFNTRVLFIYIYNLHCSHGMRSTGEVFYTRVHASGEEDSCSLRNR